MQALEQLRQTFRSHKTKDIAFRRQQLKQIISLCINEEAVIAKALQDDLQKPFFEALVLEIAFVKREAEHTLKRLAKWVKPERVHTPIVHMPGKSYTLWEPKGVVLIIAPWNYPFQLILSPLVSAIAAGNCAIIKPSELSPNVSRIIFELLPKYLDKDCFCVMAGGTKVAESLLKERFDHIFFTGSSRVGRIVMKAAAEYLTPVTLELGGKSPCYVDQDTDIAIAARRIAWGKLINTGQTCIAPDYILAHKEIFHPFLEQLKLAIEGLYGAEPIKSHSLGRIINGSHLERLKNLLVDQNIFFGGDSNQDELYMAPTIVKDPDLNSPIMQEEIFGPILPVLPIDGVDEAIDFINEREKPLALYAFSRSKSRLDNLIHSTSSGGACLNDTLCHAGISDLPFGGIGNSGMGAYHGKAGFEAFSHKRAILQRWLRPDIPARYPPYNESKIRLARHLA